MPRPHTPRDALPADEASLIAIGSATGLFSPSEADALLASSLRGVFARAPSEFHTSHARVVDGEDGAPAGWSYLAADAADGVYELLWIGVSRAAEGTGVGAALLADAEALAARADARILIIATSSTPATARARAFYTRNGYALVGTIPHFYARDDGKVIFSKAL